MAKETPKKGSPKGKRGRKSTAEDEEVKGCLDRMRADNVGSPVDIFNSADNTIEVASKTLNEILAGRKNRTTPFSTVGDLRRDFVPLPHMYWRYLFGCYGIPYRCLIDLIGPDGIGKTSMGLSMCGWTMKHSKAPALWINTETKTTLPEQIMRLLDSNFESSKAMFDRGLTAKTAHTLAEMVEALTEWVLVMRGQKTGRAKTLGVAIPLKQPLIVFIDTLSKMMTPEEAQGFYNYASYMTAKDVKTKEIGEGSNFIFSKFMHEWMRKLPGFMDQYNVIVVVGHHQNDKINMNGFGLQSFMSEDQLALFNKTKIGGRATNQNAAFQLIFGQGKSLKDASNAVIGREVNLRMDKNSYGPSGRKITYQHHTFFHDAPGFLDPVIQLDDGWLNFLADQKLLDVRFDNKLWSCASLGVFNAPASAVVRALGADGGIRDIDIARKLKIHGYFDPVQEFKDTQKVQA